ncbi:MAG: CrcB protein [Glaciecola sp.]|jgi:CrcB protein
MTALFMALAGGVGALTRVEVSRALTARGRGSWATAGINVLGAGLLALLVLSNPGSHIAQIVGVGLLGGFTTFSTWMLDSVQAPSGRRIAVLAVPIAAALAVVASIRSAMP